MDTSSKPAAEASLRIDNLCKQYPSSDKFAVKNFNLTCYRGEIVGLLGHNGAGKSTTLKCITGILPFSSGRIAINGYDVKTKPVQAKSTFGYVSDKHDVFVKMTGTQYINFMADAYGVNAATRRMRVSELDEIFCLGDRLSDTISDYSHGMRQKICMMGSLIHRPSLWIMDEPMIGLDPITSAKVRDFMIAYAKEGNCILFSSHNIDSVEKLCTRAVIIRKGEKTDDFNIGEFTAANPSMDLEEYFLSRSRTDLPDVSDGEQTTAPESPDSAEDVNK